MGIKIKKIYSIIDNIGKLNITIFSKIFEKTIVSELPKVKAMTDIESWEWHKKHAKINKDGTMTISEDEIGDGTYEIKYKKPK